MTTLWVVLIVLAALAAAALVGAPLVGWLLKKIEPEVATPGVLRGGMWIGVLERAAITGAMLLGYPEAVAVVIAIKGLGRYPELRDTPTAVRPQTTERFIIGTLASYLWAGIVGAIALVAISRL